MKLGDSILLYDDLRGQYVRGVITFLNTYKTFTEMLEFEGVKNLLPFLRDGEVAKGVEIYNNFPGSRRVEEFGCVAIGIAATDSSL
jgi:ASC-1-like (ASCH) protein